MAYDIKLYVHGVPNGQKTWGVPDGDKAYIGTFYGRKADVAAQMYVEVIQIGQNANCYYTYYRVGNFMENEGRAGGYFALTLRINYYYSDVRNIYNMMDAAYNKFIVGAAVEQTQGGTHFLVSEFSQVEKTLKDLEKEMEHYLMQFSQNQDFMSLAGFKTNATSAHRCVNILEADARQMASVVKGNGNLLVSPLFASSRESLITNKKDEEIKAVKDNAQQQIQALKTQVANAEKNVASLQANLRDANAQLMRLARSSRAASESSNYRQMAETNEPEEQKKEPLMDKIRKYIFPASCLLVSALLGGAIVFGLMSYFESEAASQDQIDLYELAADETQGAETPHDSVQQSTTSSHTVSLAESFPDAQIDIEGYSKNGSYAKGEAFIATLKKVETDLRGKWVSDDFDVNGNVIRIRRGGQCSLSYVVNTDTLKTRVVEIKLRN